MNSRRYIYEILLGPNRKDDSVKPIDTFNDFISSTYYQQKLKALIPTLDLTYTMSSFEIILSKPKLRSVGISIEQLTNQNAKVIV